MYQEFNLKELDFLQDIDFLLTKADISDKMMQLLAKVREDLKVKLSEINADFPLGTDIKTGKISKGEKYKKLPYWVLDFPKLFQIENIFALRTMAWWGNYFCVSLHLQGESLEKYRKNLLVNSTLLKGKGIYFCINTQPWDYHFGEDNYYLIDNLDENELTKNIAQKDFIKLSRKIPLTDYSRLSSFTIESFLFYLKAISD